MVIIGLTGGIGSGKSAASAAFAECGIDIVDADVVARQVVQPGSEALAKISAHFGASIIRANGSLDRAALREKIFANHDAKAWLNNLLHPLIRAQIIQQLQAAKSPYVVLVAPLLFENGLDALCQATVLIDVPETLQISRTQKRDGVSSEQVRAIMASQWSRQEKQAAATYIIDNSGTVADLKRHVESLHRQLFELATTKTSQ